MPGKTATEELEVMDLGPGGPGFGLGPGDPRGGGEAAGALPRPYRTGVWIGLGGVLMFFMALTSSYIVRQGLSNDWVPIPLPRWLWLNTAVLLASSATLERARRLRTLGPPGAFGRWWGATTALGVFFLLGQILAWRELRAGGVYLATNPSSSFFYLLTASHGLHLLGGIVTLLYLGWRQHRQRTTRAATDAAALYWHSMGGLWVYLLLLLHLGR